MTIRETYIKKQKECGIHEGDYVRVIRKAKRDEDGWCNSWVTIMNLFIGKTGIVKRIHESLGIEVHFEDYKESDYVFPYFCLEKVNNPSEVIENYEARIYDEHGIEIFIKCRILDKIKEIIKTADLEGCKIEIYETKLKTKDK